MSRLSLKQEIYEYLKTQHLMTLSTYGQEPWSAILYYAVEKDLTLYFLSDPDTKHCVAIGKNPNVSGAIYDSHQPNSSRKKLGLQFNGVAEQIGSSSAQLKAAVKMWNHHNPGVKNVISIRSLVKKTISGRFYKISPGHIQLFDSSLPKDKQVRELTY